MTFSDILYTWWYIDLAVLKTNRIFVGNRELLDTYTEKVSLVEVPRFFDSIWCRSAFPDKFIR